MAQNARDIRIDVIIFTYREDSEQVLEAARCAHRTLGKGTRFAFIDDGFCPIPREVRDKLLAEHKKSIYKKTFYPRSGNLLGPENLKGQVKEMHEAAVKFKSDILVKLDSDTLLLNKDWLTELYKDDVAVMVGSYKGLLNYPMGHCYAVKAKALAALEEDCVKYPAWAGCFEDYEIGTRLHRLANGDVDYALRYRSGADDGFYLCDPWSMPDPEHVKKARVLSCGFSLAAASRGPDADKKRKDYKDKQLLVMQAVGKVLNGESLKGE